MSIKKRSIKISNDEVYECPKCGNTMTEGLVKVYAGFVYCDAKKTSDGYHCNNKFPAIVKKTTCYSIHQYFNGTNSKQDVINFLEHELNILKG